MNLHFGALFLVQAEGERCLPPPQRVKQRTTPEKPFPDGAPRRGMSSSSRIAVSSSPRTKMRPLSGRSRPSASFSNGDFPVPATRQTAPWYAPCVKLNERSSSTTVSHRSPWLHIFKDDEPGSLAVPFLCCMPVHLSEKAQTSHQQHWVMKQIDATRIRRWPTTIGLRRCAAHALRAALARSVRSSSRRWR